MSKAELACVQAIVTIAAIIICDGCTPPLSLFSVCKSATLGPNMNLFVGVRRIAWLASSVESVLRTYPQSGLPMTRVNIIIRLWKPLFEGYEPC